MDLNSLAPKSVNMLQRTGEGSYLRQNFPKVYGALGGFLGTAPDEFEGSVMDPLTAQVRQGAEYGFPVGVATAMLPMLGLGLKRVKAAVPNLASNRMKEDAVKLYIDYNALFRKNLDPELVKELVASGEITPEIAKMLPELRKAFTSALDLPYTGKAPLYRGVDVPGIEKIRAGDVIGGQHGGAGSFSLSEKVAEGFANPHAPTVFRVKNPAGVRGRDLGALSPHAEREIAIHPDTQMMVSKITKKGNKTIVDLTPFSPGDAPGFIDKGIWSAVGGSTAASQYPQLTDSAMASYFQQQKR